MKPVLLRKTLAMATMAAVLSTSTTVQAGVVDNQSLLQEQQGQEQRLALRELLAREDLRAALVQRGVDVDVVDARIDRLSAAELQMLHERLDELPAGADSGVGLVLGIIFIFIILDLLGATDVFPRI